MLRVNGTDYELRGADPAQSLAAFCRGVAGDQSVRVACGSGACGACTVAAIPPGGHDVCTISACLAPVGSLAGYCVVTAAGMGGSKAGFHPVQERIGAFHASQCGYCTPGIVAALGAACSRAELDGRQPGAAELERSVDGNLCRCTGYRPIMDVCKSFATGVDIEDLGLHSPFSATFPGAPAGCALLLEPPAVASASGGTSGAQRDQAILCLEAGGRAWLAPSSLQQLLQGCASLPAVGNGSSVQLPRFVAGNTGAGLYKDLWPAEDRLVITLGRVKELKAVTVTESHLVVGSALTIAELIAALTAHSSLVATAAGSGKPETASAAPVPRPAGPQPFAALACMLGRIAGAHVRQAGTLGGNLVLARDKGLESDLATALLGWGASVVLLDTRAGFNGSHIAAPGLSGAATCKGNGSSNGSSSASACTTEISLEAFLHQTGRGGSSSSQEGPILQQLQQQQHQLVVAVKLPLPTAADYFWCHKVAPAYSAVHATMNAAVKLTRSASAGGSPVAAATVVLGYKSAGGWVAHRAPAAESALMYVELSGTTLAAALRALLADVSPAQHPQQFAAMSQGLLLQALAPLVQDSGCPARLERLLQVPAASPAPPPAMWGKQEFEAPPADLAPLGAPLEKDRVLLQASGEAQYTADIPAPAGTLHAAWVTSTQACASILSIDASSALREPGVAAFLCAEDLPDGRNHLAGPLPLPPEPLFASGQVDFHSQPVGLILANTQGAALRAAKSVQVAYGPPAQPAVFTIEQARERSSFYSIPGLLGGGSKADGDAAAAIAAAPRRILGGRVAVPAQYHMYMEPQSALAVPDEGGSVKVYSAAQSIDSVQKAVARALGLKYHCVEAVCRRVGGGFGGKATRNLPVAVATALAAAKTGRAVRFVQDRATDMRLNGGRCEVLAEYDVGFTQEGVIQGLCLRVFMLLGAYPDLPLDSVCMSGMIAMAYAIPNFSIDIKQCRANLPPTTFMRAPGDAQAAFIMESILEHVALHCVLPAAAVRERNFLAAPPEEEGGQQSTMRLTLGKQIPVKEYTLSLLWARLKDSCRYEQRTAEVQAFNERSPWVKRGLGMTHTRFDCFVYSKPAYVSIFADGSVLVIAGGAELGQGLTTKVKQVVLSELSKLLPEGSRPLPAELVKMGDQTTNVLPAGNTTGGSTTSESACHGVKQACQVLVQRLEPFAAKLEPGGSWADLMAKVAAANGMDSGKVPLAAIGHNRELGETGAGYGYTVWGVACSEAEINLLTGERQLLRTDILMDSGRTLNPAIDVGQVEGAFSMGLGMALSEERRTDPSTGRLLNDSLWDFHPPTASAMPRQLNVALLPGSRLERAALSAKAVGEPPIMLATSALSALQAAVRAGRAELKALASKRPGIDGSDGDSDDGSSMLLQLPAAVQSVVGAVWGSSVPNLAELLSSI